MSAEITTPLINAAEAYAQAVRRAEAAGESAEGSAGARERAGDLLTAAEVYRQARGGHSKNPPLEDTPDAALIRAALEYVSAQQHALTLARRLLDAAEALPAEAARSNSRRSRQAADGRSRRARK